VKLLICIIHGRDKGKVCDELIRAGHKATILGSSGGFLREGNATLLIGAEEDALDEIRRIIAQNCRSREQVVNITPLEAATPGSFLQTPISVPVGGAVVFTVNVEQFDRY
jgi:uncharacterized protein YaaQ